MGPDLKLAAECAKVSAWAYTWLPTVSSRLAHVLCREPERTPLPAPQGEAEAEVEAEAEAGAEAVRNCTIVAFRGTASVADFLTDGRCLMRDSGQWASDGLRCHAGFYDAIESVAYDLLCFARTARRDVFGQKRFIVTGHSLGGALALLGAKILDGAGFDVAGVYTFGQPRVGNSTWAGLYQERLGERTFRFVNEDDPVPLMPGWLSGYRNVGTDCFLPSFGPLRIDPGALFVGWRDLVGAVKAWRKGRLAFLPRHAIAAYRERLERKVEPHAKDEKDAKDTKDAKAEALCFHGTRE